MPNRWPITSGNWSNAAIWSGSLIPTSSDDVWANNQTVTIDQNITILSLRNFASASAITQGGRFVVFDNYIISSSAIVGAANSCLIYSGSNGCTINGVISASSAAAISSVDLSGSAGIININGTLHNNTGANFYNIGIINPNQIINFTGSILATAPDSRNRIFDLLSNTSPTTINISGSITSSGCEIFRCINNTVYINITGSVLSTSTTHIINLPGNYSTINILGNITGPFLNTANIHTTNIRGFVKANSSTTCISNTSNGTLVIYGEISSSNSAAAITSTGTVATNLFTGPFYNTGSFNAIFAQRMEIITPASTTWRFDTDLGGSKTLYTSNQLPGVPRQTDVRKGIQYNIGLTGSLEIPDTTTVKVGVAVDTSTGSAILTPQDFFNILTHNVNVTGSIGEQLKNSSTVQTIASTLSSFKV